MTTKAFIVHPWYGDTAPEDRLAESVRLAESIGLEVQGVHIARIRRETALLFSASQVQMLVQRLQYAQARVLVVDGELSAVQHRNLVRALAGEISDGIEVQDRAALLLNIFARRARSHEGRLQVELARMAWEKTRLTRAWSHLERQRGGLGFVGGPGETQLESDRRSLNESMRRLEARLERVRVRRGLQRRNRQRARLPTVALVGYTNAGKSTLFNALTQANVLACDLPFASLDATIRAFPLANRRRALLADTVGFVSELPAMLVTAFRSTLEEVCEAQLIVHVHDAAHPLWEEQAREVEATLTALNVPTNTPRLHAYNKCDLLEENTPNLAHHKQPSALISAREGKGLKRLCTLIATHLTPAARTMCFTLGSEHGAARAWLHAHTTRVREQWLGEERWRVEATLAEADAARFRKRFSILD